jgi:multisubunit Na+/H+ antiporter MnhC subunit
MPTDTAIVVAALVIAFAVFAVALAWADLYTRDYRAPGAKYFDGGEQKAQSREHSEKLAA